MLTEQQEEKIQELASDFKRLVDISNDDYFYKLLLYPDCFKHSLLFEEDKDKLLAELYIKLNGKILQSHQLISIR